MLAFSCWPLWDGTTEMENSRLKKPIFPQVFQKSFPIQMLNSIFKPHSYRIPGNNNQMLPIIFLLKGQ